VLSAVAHRKTEDLVEDAEAYNDAPCRRDIKSVFQACLLPACNTRDFGVCFSFCLQCLLSFLPSFLLPHQPQLLLINLCLSFLHNYNLDLSSSTSFHQPRSINLFPSIFNLSSSTAFQQSLFVDRFLATSVRQPLFSNHCSSNSARQAVFLKIYPAGLLLKLCSSSSPHQRHAINLCSKRSVKLYRPKFVFLQPPVLYQSFCTVRPSESFVQPCLATNSHCSPTWRPRESSTFYSTM